MTDEGYRRIGPTTLTMDIEEWERLRADLDEAVGLLEPLANIAEYDIGDSESDSDIYRPMERYAVGGVLKVGDLRRAADFLSRMAGGGDG